MEWSALGSAATALAVLVAAWQVREAGRQARTAFEDSLSREYREITRKIPARAHLGAELTAEEWEKTLADFLQYFDLSNQQAFLRKNRRISDATWEEWRSGIQANLALPAFKAAWEHLLSKVPERFLELQEMLNEPAKDTSSRPALRPWQPKAGLIERTGDISVRSPAPRR